MNLGTFDGFVDCACIIITLGAFAFLAHTLDTAARRGRRD